MHNLSVSFKTTPDTEFNVVLGSSMGAPNGYIISNQIGRPALLSNPPLGAHSTEKMFLGYIGKSSMDHAQQIADFYAKKAQR